MADIRLKIEEAGEPTVRTRKTKRFAPAGQSTQMIVGADGADDSTILSTSARLYGSYGLRRVYYSAFSPIPDSSKNLPLIKPPLMREHRLYQADWLYRFYGFDIGEKTLVTPDQATFFQWGIKAHQPCQLRRPRAMRSTASCRRGKLWV